MSGLVKLRDGSQVAEITLKTATVNLESLYEENFGAFFDLVEKCKDATYKFQTTPMGNSMPTLQERYLIDEDGKIHEDIRKIVLNSVEGKKFSLKLVNPILTERITVIEKTE